MNMSRFIDSSWPGVSCTTHLSVVHDGCQQWHNRALVVVQQQKVIAQEGKPSEFRLKLL